MYRPMHVRIFSGIASTYFFNDVLKLVPVKIFFTESLFTQNDIAKSYFGEIFFNDRKDKNMNYAIGNFCFET